MAVNFDGVDDRLTASNLLSFDGNGVTMSLWFNITTLALSILIEKLESSVEHKVIYTQETAGNYHVRCFLYNAFTSGELVSTTNLAVDTWYNVIFTWNGSSSASLYINGAVEHTISAGINIINATNAFLHFGRRANGDLPFHGQLSEVAIWANDLSAQNILNLSKSRIKGIPLQIEPENLLGYWPLDDFPHGTSADGLFLLDRSINANHATGDDGANNSGLTMEAESVLSYPSNIIIPGVGTSTPATPSNDNAIFFASAF